jgi:bla regulator protein blaR1
MISYLTQVTICWGLFYLLYALSLGKETFFNTNRWYLLTTLFAGLFIPLIEFQFATELQTNPILNPVYYLETITVTAQTLETNLQEIVITPVNESWSIQLILMSIYWLGVLFFASRFIFGMFQIIRLAYQGKITRKHNYFLVETNTVHLPFSFMDYLFWSKEVVFEKEDHEKIYQHELSHIKGYHSIDVLITEILCIFLWCSPFIFLYKNSLKNIHEYLADNAVLKDTPTKKYGQLLLRQSQSGLQIAQANNFIHSQLKKRILMMTRTKSQRHALLKYTAILPIAFLLVFSISAKNSFIDSSNNLTEQSVVLDTIPPDGSSEVFQVVEEMPRFPGCEDQPEEVRKNCSMKRMLGHIYTNIKYPLAAKEAGTQGTVVVSFIVEKDGSISNPEIARSIGSGCDEEVLRVVSTMPNFIPGKQRGKNVRVKFNLPVKFKLDDDTPKKVTPTNEKSRADVPVSPSDEIFKVAEEMPLFPGTSDNEASKKELFTFIFKNLQYPEEAKAAALEGMVVVSFVVTKEGVIKNPEILKSIGGGTDEEVLRVVKLMNTLPDSWTPGKQKGAYVNVQLSLPVKFKMDSEAEATERNKPAADQNSDFEKVSIFPNPSGGTINLDLYTKNNAPTTVTINDNTGKQLYKKVFKGNEIKVSDLELTNAASGLLFLSFEQDGKVFTREVVLQK